jgi:hypothetical protein
MCTCPPLVGYHRVWPVTASGQCGKERPARLDVCRRGVVGRGPAAQFRKEVKLQSKGQELRGQDYWGGTSRRRGTHHRGDHRPGMHRSPSVGLETPSILAEVIAVPALDNVREAVGQTKRMGLLQFMLLVEVSDISRRRRVR